MTEKQKKILSMRRKGMSCYAIASAAGSTRDYVGKVCRAAGLGGNIVQHLTDAEVRAAVEANGFEYIGEYINTKTNVEVKCRDCGGSFFRELHIFIDASKGLRACMCPLCRRQEWSRRRETREQKQKHDAQEKARTKAEHLSREISEEMTKRLAIHVCKNCGNEFCQMVTGYNSSLYCSEKCQSRYFNRRRCEKRYKTLMAREHDNDVSLEKLYKRDHGVCYLCGKKCDWSDGEDRDGTFVAGARYPSIDHVVPVAKGGTHTWNNIRLACRECNWKKRDTV